MSNPLTVFGYDLDSESLNSIREAFPGWEVQEIASGTVRSLERDWSPVAAALVVVSARPQMEQTLGLCRALRSQAGRAHTPIFVLVPPAAEALVRAVLSAGADGCLVVPVHPKDFVQAFAHVERGNQPGVHTRSLEPAQHEDRWRDQGGEG